MASETHPAERLATIRSLLAKAEATEFPHEAEAFTAKASELMARHSIDEALLWAQTSGHQDSDRPGEIQLTIHRPFLVQKGYLVSAVAGASGCRSVRYVGGRGSPSEVISIVGFGTDLSMVDTLVTSLFVQLTTAMTSQSPTGLTGAQVSAWRRSFIMGFAETVADRISSNRRAASEHAPDSDAERDAGPQRGPGRRATPGDSVALALVARNDAVEEELYRRYPRLSHSRVSVGSSAAGHRNGKKAGRRADVGGSRLRGARSLTPG